MILCLRPSRHENGENALGVSRRIPRTVAERTRDEAAYNEKQRERERERDGGCRRNWRENERRKRRRKRERERERESGILGRNGRVRRNIPSKTFHSPRE